MENEKATILVIDDDIVDKKIITKALSKGKVSNDILHAENGEEGLQILRKYYGEKSFLVLLDLNMPKMDGHEFLDLIRDDEKLRSTIIFVVTTSNDDVDKWKAYQNNIAGYIVKKNVAKDFIQKVLVIDDFLVSIELPPKKKPNNIP